jgi:predicted ATPase
MSVLTAGPRDLPERQRTLRNTLDWSFSLLAADEQALFARLGVFAGSFGLPAATAVCGGAVAAGQAGQPGGVVETLSSLVDSSLVRAEPDEDEPRFSLLDTIREYALERLRESGNWQDAHDRHAAYFAALAKPADTELHGAGQLAWLSRLEKRRDNLSAALSWLVEPLRRRNPDDRDQGYNPHPRPHDAPGPRPDASDPDQPAAAADRGRAQP